MLINGPNLNFLGRRDPDIYGEQSLLDIENMLVNHGRTVGVDVLCFQTNYEGKIIDLIQDAMLENFSGVIINPGAFTHYSYAIRDALDMLDFPAVEVHISDIYNREPFRATSVIKPVVSKSIVGRGVEGYIEALNYILNFINS